MAKSIFIAASVIDYAHYVDAALAQVDALERRFLVCAHINQKLYDNIKQIVAIVGAIVQLLFANEIKLGLQLIVGHEYGAVCFVINRIYYVLGGAFLLACEHITRVEWPSATLWQGHQLAVQVHAEQMKQYLEWAGDI